MKKVMLLALIGITAPSLAMKFVYGESCVFFIDKEPVRHRDAMNEKLVHTGDIEKENYPKSPKIAKNQKLPTISEE
jgi:hypothetical protein